MATKDLSSKRWRCLLGIGAVAGGNIIFTAPPKPTAEVPVAVVLTGADFVMCAAIYHEYFGERLTDGDIIDRLGGAGIITLVAGGGGYAIAKGASGLIAEFTNFLGPLGWMASGLLAAGATALLGAAWMMACDVMYQNGAISKKPALAVCK